MYGCMWGATKEMLYYIKMKIDKIHHSKVKTQLKEHFSIEFKNDITPDGIFESLIEKGIKIEWEPIKEWNLIEYGGIEYKDLEEPFRN